MKRELLWGIAMSLVLIALLGFTPYFSDWDPKKDDIVAIPFYVADASGQNQNPTSMSAAGEATAGDVSQVPMPIAGSLVGVSVQVEAARTGGTLTITPTVNLTPVATPLAIDDDPTQYSTSTWNRGAYAVAVDERLGVQWGSSNAWAAGTTPSVHVTLWYHIEDVD